MSSAHAEAQDEALVEDPVCGMMIAPAEAVGRLEHDGTTYYFCHESCLERFRDHPEQFLHPPVASNGAASPAGIEYTCPMDPEVRQIGPGPCPKCGMALEPVSVSVSTRTEWTCPMHPEIVRDEPGACPICGMALEPRRAALDERNPELDDMWRRFRAAAVLTAPLLAVMVSDMLPNRPLHQALGARATGWLQALLATPVVLWAGWPFFERAWRSLVNRHLNMFTLIGLGTGTAYLFSVAALLLPGSFPASFHSHGGELPLYFEPAAVIVALVLLGQVLELRARSRTSAAIRGLLALTPPVAHRLSAGGAEEDVALERVHVGDRLRVRPGERVPVDGIVRDGTSAVDESMVTGEAMPVSKSPDHPVTGGTVNGTGAFVMEATRVGADTLLARIVSLVGEAQRSRAPIQRLADTVSAWFVPAVIVIAILTFVGWALLGPEPRFVHGLVNAVAVLIIACPCALGLATPMSIMVGTGRGAEVGVLLRNAEALELLERIDTVVIDKTGTLTEGRPRLTAITPVAGVDESQLLRMAASVEQVSEHPVAAAIVAAARDRRIQLLEPRQFESHTGQGVTAEVDGHLVVAGTRSLIEANHVAADRLDELADRLREQGQTVVLVAIGGEPAGVIGVADPIKANARAAVSALKSDGLRLLMLTGDNRVTASAVAQSLGIDQIEADVLPERKAAVIKALQTAGAKVAMAGDGINDAPALAQADVGIAMGTGTDIAMESASITLVKGDLTGVLRARTLSRATMRNIRQNLFFAFVYNLAGVPIAAGLLYPVFGLLLSPMIASAAMTFSSVSVIANALRLRTLRL